MTIVEAVDAVILKHLGICQFGTDLRPSYWAGMVVEADANDTLLFGVSEDALALETLLRNTRSTLKGVKSLTMATKGFKPRMHTAWVVRNMIAGQERDVFNEAEQALLNLEAWIEGIVEHDTFRTQAKKSRNWRAASVAHMCRIVWAAAHWELSSRPLPKQRLNALAWPFGETEEDDQLTKRLRIEYSTYLADYAPKSEKYDAPGPFGRFLEEVFLTLGILGKDGNAFPAASALRSLADAGKQFQQKE